MKVDLHKRDDGVKPTLCWMGSITMPLGAAWQMCSSSWGCI